MSRLSRAALVFLVFTLILASTSFLPVGVSYVVSDSMEPTIGEGDGFVRVPAGNVEPGEIIVFETPEQDQRFAVHRVVRETPKGFVTKGDNNEITDQAAGHPYVQREDIRGKVLTIAGEPVVIPNFGLLAAFARSYRNLLLTLLGGLFFLDTVTGSADRPSRPPRAGTFLDGMAVVATAALLLVILLGGTTAQVTFLAVEGGTDVPNAVQMDDATTKQIQIRGLARVPFMHYAVDWQGADVVNRSWNGSTLRLTVRVPPPESPGKYPTVASVHRYPQTLPPGVIERLYSYHPLLTAVATVVPLIAPFYLLGLVLIPRGARLRKGREEWRSWHRRLDRWTR